MNKLTKIGVSALCGSLAAVASAHAGAMTVKGGATATWSQNEKSDTGNPIGLSSGMTFTGSGELDNGTSFVLTLTHTDQSAYSAGQIAMTTPSMGTFTIDQSGGGLDRLDDMMPTAWEETNGTSLGTGLQTVSGVATSPSVEWNLPSDMLPDGLAMQLAYTPRATGGAANDKASTGSATEGAGSGWDIVLAHSGLYDGLNVFGGYSVIEQAKLTGAAGATGADGDRTQRVLGATYAVGGFTIGYQYSKDAKQAVGNGVTSYYENDAYGVSFAVNDDLSISFGEHESTKVISGASDVTVTAQSLQASYSVGGASIKFAESSVDNQNYSSSTNRDGRTIALTLAF